ncbi:hypothetical protein [Nonomuraea cavernae]|nr:hypothetical protein [Nonomuraea cavernae]
MTDPDDAGHGAASTSATWSACSWGGLLGSATPSCGATSQLGPEG